jgi:anti-sigma factor RsiW
MNCREFQADLSSYADDALSTERALQMREHERVCAACAREANSLNQMRALLRTAGRVEPPPALALALRVRLSQQSSARLLDQVWVRLQNILAPVAVPAVAGLAVAVLVFGVLIRTLFFPTPVLAGDIPLALKTAPHLKAYLVEPLGFNTGEEGISLELRVNEEGRIIEFRPLNGPLDPSQLAKLRRSLLFTVFDPATTFGIPRPATTIINLSSISVKG